MKKKSTHSCSSFSQKLSIYFPTSRNLVTDTRIFLQFVSSKDSNFSITTFKISSKRVKNTCVRICKHCKQNFNFNNKFHDYIREHHVMNVHRIQHLTKLTSIQHRYFITLNVRVEFRFDVFEKSNLLHMSLQILMYLLLT